MKTSIKRKFDFGEDFGNPKNIGSSQAIKNENSNHLMKLRAGSSRTSILSKRQSPSHQAIFGNKSQEILTGTSSSKKLKIEEIDEKVENQKFDFDEKMTGANYGSDLLEFKVRRHDFEASITSENFEDHLVFDLSKEEKKSLFFWELAKNQRIFQANRAL